VSPRREADVPQKTTLREMQATQALVAAAAAHAEAASRASDGPEATPASEVAHALREREARGGEFVRGLEQKE
jgi:hypothetical protein